MKSRISCCLNMSIAGHKTNNTKKNWHFATYFKNLTFYYFLEKLFSLSLSLSLFLPENWELSFFQLKTLIVLTHFSIFVYPLFEKVVFHLITQSALTLVWTVLCASKSGYRWTRRTTQQPITEDCLSFFVFSIMRALLIFRIFIICSRSNLEFHLLRHLYT